MLETIIILEVIAISLYFLQKLIVALKLKDILSSFFCRIEMDKQHMLGCLEKESC